MSGMGEYFAHVKAFNMLSKSVSIRPHFQIAGKLFGYSTPNELVFNKFGAFGKTERLGQSLDIRVIRSFCSKSLGYEFNDLMEVGHQSLVA